MARVLLVFGEHLSGKSTLSNKLKMHHFDVISVDDVYVKWVESHCPSLYFDDLGKYIYHHYHFILAGDYTRSIFRRDLLAEWHEHLLAHIIESSQTHESLVVEGYLLFDCKDHFEIELTKQSVQVFQIDVEDRLYFSDSQPLTIDEIALLGT